MTNPERNEFDEANQKPQRNLAVECFRFLKTSKKYWLIPLIATLFLLGLLVIAGGSAAAPFIYTLF